MPQGLLKAISAVRPSELKMLSNLCSYTGKSSSPIIPRSRLHPQAAMQICFSLPHTSEARDCRVLRAQHRPAPPSAHRRPFSPSGGRAGGGPPTNRNSLPVREAECCDIHDSCDSGATPRCDCRAQAPRVHMNDHSLPFTNGAMHAMTADAQHHYTSSASELRCP